MEEYNCFLIDDDSDDRDIFELALKDIKYSCYCKTADNGVEAFKIFEKNPDLVPDFIFLDLNMPMLSGMQCLKRIKEMPQMKQVPVIIYTTSSYEKDMIEAKELGAAHFLIKPSSIIKLSELLRKIIQHKDLPYLIEVPE